MRFAQKLALIVAFGVSSSIPAAHAQSVNVMTSITATSVYAGSNPASGKICAYASDEYGNFISITKHGGGFYAKGVGFCQTLTAGALASTLSVPDSATDSVPGHPYTLTVFDTTSNSTTSLLVYGISTPTWSLDNYTSPSSTPTAQAFTLTTGTGGHPSSCIAPALDIRVNAGVALVGTCYGGAFIDATGSSGGGGGGGSMTYPAASGVTIYNAGTGTWGTSLAPTVTIDSTVCNIGGSCTLPTLPGSETRYLQAAVCNGGVAYSSAFSTYDNQQPQFGCIAPATSTAAYMDFQAAASAPQYASLTFAPPPYWTDSDLILTFAGTATTGNVSWIVDVGCTSPNGDLSAPTYGSSFTSTTTVSTTALGLVNSAKMTGIAVPGANGCTAGTTSAGSLVTVRIHRSASDTAAGDAHLIGAILTSDRSQ